LTGRKTWKCCNWDCPESASILAIFTEITAIQPWAGLLEKCNENKSKASNQDCGLV
jgi:hypothetical protein